MEDVVHNETTKQIVILGCGIAGLAAAEELERLGINDFVILEARNRTGGRVWDIQESKISLGAHWIHGLIPSNPIHELAMSQRLLVHPTSPDDDPGDDTMLVELERGTDDKFNTNISVLTTSNGSSPAQLQSLNLSKEVSVISNEVYSSVTDMYQWMRASLCDESFAKQMMIDDEDMSILDAFKYSMNQYFLIKKQDKLEQNNSNTSQGSKTMPNKPDTQTETKHEKINGELDISIGPTQVHRVLEWFYNRVEIDVAMKIDKLDFKEWVEQTVDGEDGEALVDGGMAQMFENTANRLIKQNKIKFNYFTNKIEYNQDTQQNTITSEMYLSNISNNINDDSNHITMNTSPQQNGSTSPSRRSLKAQTFKSQYCLVTLPLGVLKAGHVEFSPPLPDYKQTALQSMEMGVLDIVVMTFPTPFWERAIPGFTNDINYIGVAHDRDDIVLFSTLLNISGIRKKQRKQRQLRKYEGEKKDRISDTKEETELDTELDTETETEEDIPGVLMAQVFDTEAYRLEKLTSGELENEVNVFMRRVFGVQAEPVKEVRMSHWASDPCSLGSYATVPCGVSATCYDDLAEPVPERGLYFAGEATHRDWPNTVQAAYISGIREARRIHADMQDKEKA
mmetsp:Transcript_30029/g.30482  ORF Transcript_30029/g.30482 Transcript_30029/m.30482 type:complete len:623 (-) Transcript_30029:160-2028(-)